MACMTASPVERETAWVPELTFAARLALVRHSMGWNLAEAALECGFKAQSWRGWELEHRLPRDRVEVADRIAERTGIDAEWILRGGPLTSKNANVRSGFSAVDRTHHHPISRPPRGAGKTTSPVPPTRRRPAPARPARPDHGAPVNNA